MIHLYQPIHLYRSVQKTDDKCHKPIKQNMTLGRNNYTKLYGHNPVKKTDICNNMYLYHGIAISNRNHGLVLLTDVVRTSPTYGNGHIIVNYYFTSHFIKAGFQCASL